jgi:type II secretory pathway pseudopilin PulG
VTLIELLVSSAVMMLAGAMFTTAFLQMTRVLNNNDALTTAQQQLSTAYERLDRDVRYATVISVPGTTGGDYYVEYVLSVNGTSTCTELRLNSTAQLQRRTWPNGSTAAANPWAVLASGVKVVSGTAPFVLLPADTVLNYPRLQVTLQSSAGGGSTSATRQSSATWAAVNATTPDDDVCTEKRGTT